VCNAPMALLRRSTGFAEDGIGPDLRRGPPDPVGDFDHNPEVGAVAGRTRQVCFMLLLQYLCCCSSTRECGVRGVIASSPELRCCCHQTLAARTLALRAPFT